MNKKGINGKKDTAKRDEFWGRVQPLYERLVLGLKKRLKKQDEDVGRDALHTVFVRLVEGRPKDVQDSKIYLTKCAVNEHRHGHRNGRLVFFSELSNEDREGLDDIRAPGRTPAEEAAERECWTRLREEIARLPKRQRQVLTLDLEERTDDEIRVVLGLKSVASVRSHRRYAIAKLRKKFPAEE